MLQALRQTIRSRPALRRRAISARTEVFRMLDRVHEALGGHEEHWGRVVMNRETLALVKALPTARMDAAEISGRFWADRAPFASYRSLHYPDFDICAGPADDRFDIVFAEQVFEHLLWPYRAVRNVHTMLRPGGYFLVTTPFLVRIHEEPFDCSRWSPTGLRHLLAEGGFALENIVTCSWGNRACVKANLSRWVRYRAKTHDLTNEPAYPFSVWAFARRD